MEQTALLKLVYFKSKERTFLFICAHHLVIDGVSWRILLDDFLVLKNQLKLGQQLKLPYQTLSYRQWLKALKDHGDKESVHSETNYWENIEAEIKEGKLISLRQNKSGITSSFKNQPLFLDAELTGKLLEQCNAEQDIQINDLLLTALSFAMDKTTGQKKLAINLEGHGRESIDRNIRIDRTIGWFTTIYPVVLNCKASNIQELLSKTRLNLREIPKKGFNYGVLKYCSEKLVPKSAADCSFNFMGSMDVHSNELTMSLYDTGRTMAEENNLWSPLNFNGVIQNNCLRFDIDFDQTYFSQDFIERLIQSFKTALYLLAGSDFDGQEKQIFPLTPAQEGLLFQKLSDESSEAYSTQTMFEVVGESPDIDQLKEAISCLAIKHHALSFKVVKDESQEYGQCLEEGQLIEVKEYDYSRSSQAVEEVLTMVSSSELNREFLLEEGNLFRVSIVLAPEERIFLLFNFHHIVFDGWSLSNLLLTLSELYQFNMNRQFQSSEEYLAESDKYEEFLTHIKAQDDGEKKVYWTKLLEGYDSPSDFKLLETEVQTEKTHESERLTVSPHLYESLSQMSVQSSVTKNTIMEVVWGLLLQKYNYTNDAVFGKVVSGRNYPVNRIGEIVGMLINTIPIRICSKEDENISELIQHTQQQSFDSQDFHGSSLASIQQWLNRDTPLISTIYSYSSFVVENQLFPLSEKTDLKIHGGLEKVNYDIACSVYDNSDSMSIQLTYNPQKFESSTIKNILSTMENILEFLCVYPTAKVSEIQVLNQEQLTDLYFNSEAESVEVSMDTIPKEITKRAIENPEKTAIHFSDQRITFRELDERSNAVANALLSKGIKLEDKVGIFLPKTPFTIIAILGVMKAGACCVTMDSATPLERVAYQMQDAEAAFLISDQTILSTGVEVILPEQFNLTIGVKAPNVSLTKNNLAYVLYTSGSTGKPKGSLIEYAGLMNLFDYIGVKYQLNKEARVLQYASLSFDASLLEIFGALVNNAELVVVPEEDRKSPEEIVRLIREKEVTFALIPPAMMSCFQPEDFPTLKFVMNAGEEASPEIARAWSQKMNYINGYGPSEATIWTTDWNAYRLQQDIQKCPIGKPIQNVSVHILNGQVPVGNDIPGELCISGISLSRGYLNRKELNEKVFFENKLVAANRIYRTGDLVRRLPGGDIEYLGRVDQQVKIRGHRIELSEIEEVLQKIPGIDQAACCVVTDNNAKRLVAYLISTSVLSLPEIRSYLLKKIPKYMVPDRFVEFEEIPTTQNGKTDRKSLEALGFPNVKSEKREEMTTEEKEICDFFETVSGSKIFSMDQPLSDIIGDSISAMKAAAKLKKAGYEISIKDLLDGKTTRELSLRKNNICLVEIEEKGMDSMNKKEPMSELDIQYKEDISCKVPIDIYKATRMQAWIHQQPSTVSGAIIDLQGEYTDDAVEHAIRNVIQHNGVLRSSYRYINHELFINEYSASDNWKVSIVDLSSCGIEEVDRIYLQEQRRFDCNEIFCSEELASELIVFKEKFGHYRVYLRIQHILWDARSAEIFEEQIRGCLETPSIPLKEAPGYKQYVDTVQAHSLSGHSSKVYHEELPMEQFKRASQLHKGRREEKNSDTLSTIVITPSMKTEDSLLTNLWGVLGKIILSYDRQFDKTRSNAKNSPAFILYHGRSGKTEMFKHTMGLFLELVPILVSDQNVEILDISLKSQLETYKSLKKHICIDFLEYLSFLETGAGECFDYDHIPVLNFLGIYDFLDESDAFSNTQMKRLKKSTSNHALIVSVKNEAIQISMYANEDRAMAVKNEIEKEMNMMEV
ncbi:amino acid adenylation domain-containing protein [Enterococcus sp. BWB1-3]|uniref:amino acid adenylation domain-containing protein n=1 Tax=Enterococcus sp. BWB1-3 TaxID=2787713 RepID=UPI002ED6AA48